MASCFVGRLPTVQILQRLLANTAGGVLRQRRRGVDRRELFALPCFLRGCFPVTDSSVLHPSPPTTHTCLSRGSRRARCTPLAIDERAARHLAQDRSLRWP